MAAEAVARRSYGKLVAFLAARTRDVAAAEDALADAFAAALADWPAKRRAAKPRSVAAHASRGAGRSTRRGGGAPARRRRTRLRLIAEELEAAAMNATRFPTSASR